MLNKHWIALGVIALIICVFDLPNGLGFILGSVIVQGLAIVRNRYYKVLLNSDSFQSKSYIAYIFFMFVALWLPLGVAFFAPLVIGPFGYAGAILLDRMILYLKGLFKEERGVE